MASASIQGCQAGNHSSPLLPRNLQKRAMPTPTGSSEGPHSLQVSTEKPDAIQNRKQAGEGHHGTRKGQVNLGLWGSPEPTQRARVHGQEVPKDETENFPVPMRPLLAGLQGSPAAGPQPWVNTEPFETSKAQAEGSEGKGWWEHKCDLEQEGPPAPPG